MDEHKYDHVKCRKLIVDKKEKKKYDELAKDPKAWHEEQAKRGIYIATDERGIKWYI